MISKKKLKVFTLLSSIFIIFLSWFSIMAYGELEKLEMKVDSSIETYLNQIADAFRWTENDDILIESLYYFDAFASLKEDEDLYSISNRLVLYTKRENLDKLETTDRVYIADFLDLMNSDSPPNSNQILEFLNNIVLITKE